MPRSLRLVIALVAQNAATVIDCQPPQPFVPQKSFEHHSTTSNPSKYKPVHTSPDHLPSPPATPSVSEASYPTTPCTSMPTSSAQLDIPPLDEFVRYVVKRSNVQTGTLLASLVYTGRLQRKLVDVAKGLACTCHRIFLATLIVTSKYLNDTSPKNKHWARYAVVFSVPEINLMEKQLLFLLVSSGDLNFVRKTMCHPRTSSRLPALSDVLRKGKEQHSARAPANTHADTATSISPLGMCGRVRHCCLSHPL